MADEREPTQTVEPTQAKAGLLDELLGLDGGNTNVTPTKVAVADAPPGQVLHLGTLGMLGTRVGRFVGWAHGEAPKVEFSGNDRGPLVARSIITLDPSVVAAAIAEHRGVLLTFEDGRPDAPIITGLLQPLIHVDPMLLRHTPEPERQGPEPEPPKPKPEPPRPMPEPDKPGPISPEPPEPISPQPKDPGGPSQPGPEFEPPTGPEYEPPSEPGFQPRPGPEFEPSTEPQFEPQPEPEFDPMREPDQVEFISETSEFDPLDPLDPLDMRVDGRRVEIEAADEIVLRCGQASIVMRRNGRVVIRGTYVETRSRGVNRVKGGSVEIN